MTIDINPDTERVVREELREGHFRSVDELIISGVHAWRERNLPQGSGTGNVTSAARADARDRAREFVEWAKSHPVTPALPDAAISRASLNPDRW